MAINVVKSEKIDVDLSEAADGDKLRLTFEDNSRLVINAHLISSAVNFYVEYEYMPPDLLAFAWEQVVRVLERPVELADWCANSESAPTSDRLLHRVLHEHFTKSCYIETWEVGEMPTVTLVNPFQHHVKLSLSKWVSPSKVVRIEAIDSWQARLEAEKVAALREIASLSRL